MRTIPRLSRYALKGVAALWISAASSSSAQTVDITACDQDVPRGQLGVLQNDLTCDTRYAVNLDTGATLDMQGFSITAIPMPDLPGPEPPQTVVYCATEEEQAHTRCQVISSGANPGVIVGNGTASYGIFGDRVNVDNVSVSGCAINAIYGDRGATVHNASIADSDVGILSEVKVTAEDVTLTDNATGIASKKKISAANVTVNGSTTAGLVAQRNVRAEGLAAASNAVTIHADHVRLEDSTLSGNEIDIAAGHSPRLKATTCETSRKIAFGGITAETWGVCSGD